MIRKHHPRWEGKCNITLASTQCAVVITVLRVHLKNMYVLLLSSKIHKRGGTTTRLEYTFQFISLCNLISYNKTALSCVKPNNWLIYMNSESSPAWRELYKDFERHVTYFKFRKKLTFKEFNEISHNNPPMLLISN